MYTDKEGKKKSHIIVEPLVSSLCLEFKKTFHPREGEPPYRSAPERRRWPRGENIVEYFYAYQKKRKRKENPPTKRFGMGGNIRSTTPLPSLGKIDLGQRYRVTFC